MRCIQLARGDLLAKLGRKEKARESIVRGQAAAIPIRMSSSMFRNLWRLALKALAPGQHALNSNLTARSQGRAAIALHRLQW